VSALFLIGCANIAGLFLVRASERGREMAIRLAMGAGRGRIARQLLAESGLLSLTGGGLGVALAAAGLGAFRAFGPADLPRIDEIGIDIRVLAFSAVACASAAMAFGLAPALTVMRTSLAGDLREAARHATSTRGHAGLRQALVVVQVSLAVVLLTGAALLTNSLVRLGRVDPGFDPRDVVWLDVTLPPRYAGPPARLAFFTDLLAESRAATGVVAAGAIAGRPLGGGNAIAPVQPEAPLPVDAQATPRIPLHVVTPGYFAALSVPLLDGRDVSDDDRGTSAGVAVVSRAFAERFWPGERAVGKRFWMGRVSADAPLIEVVGVAADVRQYGLAQAPEPIVYRPAAQASLPVATLSLIVRHDGRGARQVIDQVRAAAWRLDPALPLDRFGTMEATVHASIGEPRFRAMALSLFGGIATLVAGVGLYATLAWVVRARRRELGIRMALGADARAVRRLVVRRGLTLAIAGVILGGGTATVASRLLASMVFGITPTDAPTFAAAAMAMLATAGLACWIPALRAGRVDPVETLRAD
jgi:putative ABC transport system permease protein